MPSVLPRTLTIISFHPYHSATDFAARTNWVLTFKTVGQRIDLRLSDFSHCPCARILGSPKYLWAGLRTQGQD